eukprot:scaffold704_cov347-Prasinococcus_capsulatus_cf.AAC.18
MTAPREVVRDLELQVLRLGVQLALRVSESAAKLLQGDFGLLAVLNEFQVLLLQLVKDAEELLGIGEVHWRHYHCWP